MFLAKLMGEMTVISLCFSIIFNFSILINIKPIQWITISSEDIYDSIFQIIKYKLLLHVYLQIQRLTIYDSTKNLNKWLLQIIYI